VVDADYEARKQAQIDLWNQKALERLEEINLIVASVTSCYSIPSTEDYRLFKSITDGELSAYKQWLESKLEMLKLEAEKRSHD